MRRFLPIGTECDRFLGFLVANETRILCDCFDSEDYLRRAFFGSHVLSEMPGAALEWSQGLDSVIAETHALAAMQLKHSR